MNNSNKILILFTEDFPFGSNETFIESEIFYLSENFRVVYIISKNKSSNNKRPLPKNVFTKEYNFKISLIEKIGSLVQVLSIKALKELLFMRRLRVKFNRVNFYILLKSLIESKRVSNIINDLITNNHSSDKIYLYSYWWMSEALGIARYKNKNKNVKAFSRAHRMDIYFYAHPNNYLPFKKYMLDNLDAIFLISKDGMNYILEDLELNPSKKLILSYLGTNNNIVPNLNLTSKFNRILSCSNIYPNKRVHLIASSILESKTIVEWDHFGEYMNFTSDLYKENLEKIKDQLQKFNCKLNFPGRISNNEIFEILNEKNYDFHINLSESEGVPVSIMESFSFGIPVIATNVGGVSEIVIDGYNGFLINPNSSSSDVARIINKFYSLDLNEINNLRNNAFLTWNKKFNADSNYKLFINQIESL
jgi:colanic acid/amylovoran biosynthesis glycosyltransferase